MKPPLLYVTHRIPFPPNKGDKIRTYHYLKYLSERFRVFLGTFIDDKADLQYQDEVKSLCEDVYFARISDNVAKIKSLGGFIRREPLTCAYYRHRGLMNWVRRTIENEGIEDILVSSSGVAQFVISDRFSACNRVVDFIDVDSEKWRQYAAQKAWPMSWIYRREARVLLSVEERISCAFDGSLFVSRREADLFKELAPQCRNKVGFVANGVDLDFFSNASSFPSPYPSADPVVVFAGAMDYWPNIDAALYFADVVFPHVLEKAPETRFVVVGRNPDKRVLALAERDAISVTGSVDDMRPYVANATVSVAPLKIARGVQNKVLESMALEVPTVVTPQALEGIGAIPGKEVLVGTDEIEISANVLKVIRGDIDRNLLGRAARSRVAEDFGWNANLAKLEDYLPMPSPGRSGVKVAIGK